VAPGERREEALLLAEPNYCDGRPPLTGSTADPSEDGSRKSNCPCHHLLASSAQLCYRTFQLRLVGRYLGFKRNKLTQYQQSRP
jgi:hypothetical protein